MEQVCLLIRRQSKHKLLLILLDKLLALKFTASFLADRATTLLVTVRRESNPRCPTNAYW